MWWFWKQHHRSKYSEIAKNYRAPPNGRPAAVATDRSEGDIVVVGVGGGSVESEGQTALLGDSGVVR